MSKQSCLESQLFRSIFLALSFSVLFASACGGGGSSAPKAPANDFTISASATNLLVGSGQTQTVTISVAAINSFTSAVAVSVSGLPYGISASPASFNLSPGSQQVVTVTASATAMPATGALTFQGTAGGLSHKANVSLNVTAIVTGRHPPIRTQFRRTYFFYDSNSLEYAPPHFAVYDAAHRRFFVSNFTMNEIDVFDAVSEEETARIPVPFAWGLDISPIDGSLYAGTYIGDIYRIDTGKLTVIKRYLSSSIGPNGFVATTALVLADGRLVLQGAPGAILAADGYGAPAIWDPTSNTLYMGNGGFLCQIAANGAIALSGDRTRVLMTWVDAGGGGSPVCSYDTVADIATYGNFPFDSFVRQIIPTPDGKRFFLTSTEAGVGVFDIATMKVIGQITNPNTNSIHSGDIPNAAGSAVISLDGKTLYLVDQGTGAVGAFDTTTLAQTGWVPSTFSNNFLVISAVDETGLIIGPAGSTGGGSGVGFIDAAKTTTTQPTMLGAGYGTATTGPETGGTTISEFLVANVTDNAVPTAIYVGNQPGTQPSFIAKPGFINSAQVTTPWSNVTGLVDLAMVLSDGGVGLVPEGFTYGPGVLEVVPNAATAEGGQKGALIGVGFGSDPSKVQVTIGGRDAPVSEVHDYQNWLRFKIPPGTAGTSVDVTITTSSGSTTLKDAFRYTPALETYPISATLQDGIYDAGRDLYYFTDQTKIQVLSRSTKTWLTPISLPGVIGSTQLLAISESPDGSTLAVSDYGGGAIYVLNPDTPATTRRFPLTVPAGTATAVIKPSGLAVNNAGDVYFIPAGGWGVSTLLKLDGSSGAIKDLASGVTGELDTNDEFHRVIMSRDGRRVYTAIGAECVWADTSNDQVHASRDNRPASNDLAVSADGSTVYMDWYFTDGSLQLENKPAYIDWETWFPVATLGAKLSPDGSLLFQPFTNAIDVMSRNTGHLLYRMQVSIPPALNYNPLVSTDNEATFAWIGANSVSFVDLSSLPVPPEYRTPFL
jgi:hypothetical protein